MQTNQLIPEGFSPSCKRVLGMLAIGYGMTPTELQQATGLSLSTINKALKKLLNYGLVYKKMTFNDTRQRIYQTK